MAMSRNWLRIVRKKFYRSSHKTIIVLHTNSTSNANLDLDDNEELITVGSERDEATSSGERNYTITEKKELSREDLAAIKIQSVFRGRLARWAYRALKSLVKLQALVRGVCVRRQTRIALHCMHALVRLQVRVRARQLSVVMND